MANGQGGMLTQAAQTAAQVPAPAQLQQPAGPAPAGPGGPVGPGGPAGPGGPGPMQAPQPGALGQIPGPETVAPGSDIPGQQVAGMPVEGHAYQGEDIKLPEDPATETEEREYERVSSALKRILYEEDNLSDSVMRQLDPNDLIGTTTKATALLIQQLDEKVDMDEMVIPQITMDAVDAVSEMAEARFDVAFSEQQLQATLGATWEAVMGMFGVDPQELQKMEAEYSGQMEGLKKSYDGFLAQGEQVPQIPGGPPPGMPPMPGGQAPAAAPPGMPTAAPPGMPAAAPPGMPPAGQIPPGGPVGG